MSTCIRCGRSSELVYGKHPVDCVNADEYAEDNAKIIDYKTHKFVCDSCINCGNIDLDSSIEELEKHTI